VFVIALVFLQQFRLKKERKEQKAEGAEKKRTKAAPKNENKRRRKKIKCLHPMSPFQSCIHCILELSLRRV